MPCAIPTTRLPVIHDNWRRDQYDHLSEEEFTELVCNTKISLPQERLDGANALHLPCMWLGDTEPRGILPEDRQRQARRRFGWKKGMKYLILLPNPADIDIENDLALSPRCTGGKLFREQLEQAGIDLKDVMVTHVCRFALPETVRNYAQSHHADGIHYVQRDIEEIKPDVIISCGAASLRALFGKKAKLDTYRGNVIRYKNEEVSIPVIPTVSHLAFLGGYANISVFQDELARAREIVTRGRDVNRREADYRVCETFEEVKALCDEIRQADPQYLAFDTEYGNDYAREEFSYTLSLQLAWAPGKAAFIKLRTQEELPPPEPTWLSFEDFVKEAYKRPETILRKTGDALLPAKRKYAKYVEKLERKARGIKGHDFHYEDGITRFLAGRKFQTEEETAQIWEEAQRLLLDKRWRLCAHHLRVDVEQFARNGYPIDDRIADGIDTMLIHHLLYGDEDQGLDHVVRKYVPEFGAFWMELEEWLEHNGRKHHLQFGYRDIPLDILIPYACKDADATLQAAEKLVVELQQHPKLCALYYNHVAATSLHLMDVERHGILIDEEQRSTLYDTYQPVHERMLEKVREMISWPSFNPGSSDDLRALLFSEYPYREKKYKYVWSGDAEGDAKHAVPEGAKALGLKPLVNTDKYPREWSEIEEHGEENLHAPSTKAETLELLYHKYPDVEELRWLKHLSVIGKFLSTYLAPNTVNEFGVPKDGNGLQNNIYQDGRVRTHLSQLTETGRYTSSRANLQTKPKKQEAAAFAALVDFYFGMSVKEYKDACKSGEIPEDRQITVPKFASCFVAPEGYCLIEADFKTAELFIWAYCSGDKKLIAVVDQGRDLHSEVAARAFKLPEGGKPLDDAIAAIEAGDKATYDAWSDNIKDKYGAIRVAAKSVNFGVMYGRGAMALTREINKVVDQPVTTEDTQQIIDGFAESFPDAWDWINNNALMAVRNEYIENAFGRRRYFQGANKLSQRDQAAIMREAKNSPIQGAVADLLAQAGRHLYTLNKTLEAKGRGIDMKILLPIHDAFLFQVKNEDVPRAVKAIELCMAKKNTLPGTPYHLQLDIEIMEHRWSDKAYHDADSFMEHLAEAA